MRTSTSLRLATSTLLSMPGKLKKPRLEPKPNYEEGAFEQRVGRPHP